MANVSQWLSRICKWFTRVVEGWLATKICQITIPLKNIHNFVDKSFHNYKTQFISFYRACPSHHVFKYCTFLNLQGFAYSLHLIIYSMWATAYIYCISARMSGPLGSDFPRFQPFYMGDRSLSVKVIHFHWHFPVSFHFHI